MKPFFSYYCLSQLENLFSLEEQSIKDDANIEMKISDGLKGGADRPAVDEANDNTESQGAFTNSNESQRYYPILMYQYVGFKLHFS